MIYTDKIKHPGILGGVISLLGTLPFGVLNILAFTIAGTESVGNAVLFSIGVMVSEIAVVAGCLKWLKPFRLKSNLFQILQYAMVGFIFFLAIQQLLQIGHMSNQRSDLLATDCPRFFLGLGLSAINPSQFPFWIAWNSILSNKQLLETRKSRVSYLAGIGTGTFFGLLCFVLTSQLVKSSANVFQSTSYSLTMAGVFLFTGGFMLFRLLQKRTATA